MEDWAQSSSKMASAPGTPLRQLSAEQVNQQRMPQSPSLHSYLSDGLQRGHHHRDSASSMVQDKIAFLNSLSGSPTRPSPVRADMPSSPSKSSAVTRAMMGYEESQKALAQAQAEVEDLKAVVKNQAKKLDLVSNRTDKLLQQLADEKAESENMRTQYIKEVKKVRKQCFQAEKSQLEAAEELREAKKELRKRDAELQSERQKKEEARQESFERAYTVAGLTEEVEVLRDKIKVVEQEKDAAVLELRSNAVRWAGRIEKEASSASMRAHEMVRKASQSEDVGDEEATPKASRAQRPDARDHICSQSASTVKQPFSSDFVDYSIGERAFNGETFTLQDHVDALYSEVAYYKKALRDSKDTISLMYMECRFQNCECRRAEKNGKRFIHDHQYERKIEEQHTAKKRRIEEDEKANTLPPEPNQQHVSNAVEDTIMNEARQIPLPQDVTNMSTSRDSTPEATAILEELTQVLVEPVPSRANPNFTFSTSTSRRMHSKTAAPTLPRAESAMAAPTEPDLFNMSPPKRHPARPATVLGVRSTGLNSPVRHSRQLEPLTQSVNSLEESVTLHTTTRIALRDTSPPRSSHRRAQSKNNARGQSRPRSPLAPLKVNNEYNKSASASPASSTVFPVTPKSRPLHARAHTHHNVPTLSASQTFTTTTTIPLRGDDEILHSHHDYTSTPSSLVRPHTQPISLPTGCSRKNHEQILNVPGTPVSREAALAQIRARRDRARSLNQSSGLKSAPGSAKRGIVLRDVASGRSADREVSVASMASAPGRFD